ncbi:DUF2264 domain-containing protein [Sphingobacterium sp. HJSM2_6]|uniref:DUF2264 domain-containing protein n=1 Tax=Sphingobacterium sp. HJSM2_6 TaxID=3366264 RepID=UPI003BE837FE
MKRRTWLQQAGLFIGGISLSNHGNLVEDNKNRMRPKLENEHSNDRAYWVSIIHKMAAPILENISQETFQKNMPMVVSESFDGRNPKVGYLEAFGRLLAGIAPWLALPNDGSEEGKIRDKLLKQALLGIQHGVNPNSPDYFAWRDQSKQTLVDAAHLALAFLRAPKTLWDPLPARTKQQVIAEFKHIRWIVPNESNWLLFAAMTETFLFHVGVEPERIKIDHAIEKFDKDWYVGDGWYSDGDRFSFDHYNGFVIHCMLVETLKHNTPVSEKYEEQYQRAYRRMQRYAVHLERMISPDGYYPVIGRSSTYRNGGFQPLAAVALDNKLPESLSPAQVRCAMTAMLKNIYNHELYDQHGWLVLGLTSANQGNIADSYTNSGSLYEASLSFIALGLPETDPFWSSKPEQWTSQKAFSGQKFPRDYYVTY